VSAVICEITYDVLEVLRKERVCTV